MPRWAKRVVTLVLVAFALFVLVTRPEAVATAVRDFSALLTQFFRYVQSLVM